jgi:hypothetical protein
MMPVLARVYHVSPLDQRRLTLAELRALREDYDRLQAEGE